jgi:hypothetical protein
MFLYETKGAGIVHFLILLALPETGRKKNSDVRVDRFHLPICLSTGLFRLITSGEIHQYPKRLPPPALWSKNGSLICLFILAFPFALAFSFTRFVGRHTIEHEIAAFEGVEFSGAWFYAKLLRDISPSFPFILLVCLHY